MTTIRIRAERIADLLFIFLALLFYAFNALAYATNDEEVMRSLLDGSYLGYIDPNVSFINIALSSFIAGLYHIGGVDWFSIVYFIVAVSGCYAIWLYLRSAATRPVMKFIAFLLASYLMIEVLYRTNFTMVASVAAVGGFCLYELRRISLLPDKLLQVGMWLLIIVGVCLREDSFFLVSLVYVSTILIFNGLGSIVTRFKWLLSILLVAITFVGFNQIYYKVIMGDDWASYKKGLEVKQIFADGKLLSHGDLPEGWTMSDRLMLESFFYEQRPVYSVESLKKVKANHSIPSIPKFLDSKLWLLMNGSDHRSWLLTVTLLPIWLLITLNLKRRYVFRSILLAGIIFSVIILVFLYLKLPFRVYFSFAGTMMVFLFGFGAQTGYRLRFSHALLLLFGLGIGIHIVAFRLCPYIVAGKEHVEKIDIDKEELAAVIGQLPDNTKIVGAEYVYSFVNSKMFSYPSNTDVYKNYYKMGWLIGMPTVEAKATDVGIIPEPNAPVYYNALNRDDVLLLTSPYVSSLLPNYFLETYDVKLQMDTVATLKKATLYKLRTQ